MILKKINKSFTVCKVKNINEIDFSDEYCFVGKTDEELSLVYTEGKAPKDCIEREDGWTAFRIEGTLDFSLIGIISKISVALAEEKIGVFVVSTFNTDYVLVKTENFENAKNKLISLGYEFI